VTTGLLVTAAALFAGLSLVGKYSLGRMLAQDALVTAELLSKTALKDPLRRAPTGLTRADTNRLAELLSIAHADALLSIPAHGAPVPLLGPPSEARSDFQRATAAALPAGRTPFDLKTGTYTANAIRWLGQPPYHSWVVYPPDDERTGRLAVRIEQTATAAQMTRAFAREVMFSAGVALVTFIAFIAGFNYRQRQLAAENTAIRHLALHDGLTGLPNRKQFDEFVGEVLASASKEGHKTALFLLDLDGFKAVNDTLGHPVGDGLLRAAAKRLKSSLRAGDFLARLSGDEFVIVVPKVADPSILAPLAERVLQLLSSPFRIEGHEVQVGCSIGLAVAPDNGTDIDVLIRNADFALYRAKSEGRRTWRFFDPKMAADLASRRTLEDGLRHALEHEHFQLLYQPQVELATGRTVGYEAMLRWRLPGKGLVPASIFVSLAEETGLVVPIGEWVIRQVARDCSLLPSDRRVAINLSAAQLKRDGIESFVAETLHSQNIAPQRVEIEVNETIFGRNEAVAFSRLANIRELGVAIVMDSFGVGTVSLGLLTRYSFDKIKLDRSFLMPDEQKSGAVLAAICSLGRSLGFHVAGQGVETIEHAQLLRTAGCAEAQGYYFAPPMPIEQILQMEQENERPQRAARA
jgi:diguanylate cyclase (GGDEF)-like protein